MAVVTGNLTDAATGRPLRYVEVLAFDPNVKFLDGATTDDLGRFRLNLYAGTFVLAVNENYEKVQPRAVRVTVSGDTNVDLALGPLPKDGVQWDLRFPQWNASDIRVSRIVAYANGTYRALADWHGDFDGQASASELLVYMPYKTRTMDPRPAFFPLEISVDDRSLEYQTSSVAGALNGGDPTSTLPIVVQYDHTYANATPAVAAEVHNVSVRMLYDNVDFNFTARISLPAGTPVEVRGDVNVSVRPISPADTWEIDPGNPPPGATLGGATLQIGPIPTTGGQTPLGTLFLLVLLLAIPVIVAGVLVWRFRRNKPKSPPAAGP